MNYIVYQNPNNDNIELLIPCLDVNLYFDEIVKDIPKNDLGEIPDYIIVNEIPKFIETYDLKNKLIKRNRNKLINFKLNEWRNLRKPISRLMISIYKEKSSKLKTKDEIELFLPIAHKDDLQIMETVLAKQSFAKSIQYTDIAIPGASASVVGNLQCYYKTDKVIDNTLQIEQMKKDILYYKGFLESIEKKLGNERFMQNAKPEIIEIETKKKNDAIEKMRMIEESLNLL
jgi:valyl-tRNA synthetase